MVRTTGDSFQIFDILNELLINSWFEVAPALQWADYDPTTTWADAENVPAPQASAINTIAARSLARARRWPGQANAARAAFHIRNVLATRRSRLNRSLTICIDVPEIFEQKSNLRDAKTRAHSAIEFDKNCVSCFVQKSNP